MCYKVWVHVEAISDDGTCEEVTEPVDVFVSQTLPEALATAEKLMTFANMLKG